jgi:L-ascorbate metabolism protein UlaG (beta-lactamase superfamily)
LKISRILHAGYVFESNGTQILFDPLFENPFSKNCYAYPNVSFDCMAIQALTPDAVFISHYHDDHCSFESLKHLNREIEIYIYCIHDELFDLVKQLGFKKVYPLKTDITVTKGAFAVTPRLALDSDVDSIFHIQAEGLNVLNVVDAWIDPSAFEFLNQTQWDMVLWPFQTMRETEVIAPELAQPPELPEEWLAQLRELNPRYVVPSSCQFIQEEWSWYREAYFPVSYSHFQSVVRKMLPHTLIQRIDPGVSFVLKPKELKPSEPLSWISAVGPQDMDYSYNPKVVPTPTSEIAKKLPAITDEQMKRVLDFCENELISRYKSLNTTVAGIWKLSLFDHNGKEKTLSYQIAPNEMKIIKQNSDQGWVTEAPAIKILSALEEGEALNSLYIRMRGLPFDNIFEDPLVTGLFDGDYFSYQRNQLKRLR